MRWQRAYLRVTVDGTVKFDGRTTPGSAYPFEGRERIEVLTGRAEIDGLSAVPEPSTWLLALAGAACLGCMRWLRAR